MHLHFEQNNSAKCDCSILSLSWMGKVPEELPEDEGWKLNRTNYYQEGWLATGNVRGIVGVTFTSSHCRKNADVPLRTNYNLRGHRSDVILVKWNEPYQKLASCDSSGVIFVWIKYEGRWSIELINDRNTPVTHFSWSHDGRMALICYQDGFVLVGSVAGQRYWSSMLNLEATITCGIWTPDDQQVYFGTTGGQIIVMDVHGAMVSQVQLSSDVGITSMAWSCEKFKMEEGEDAEPGVANAAERTFVLAVSFQNGYIYLLKNYDDVSPVHIHTEFDGNYMAMEWSNSRELLAVAGALVDNEGRALDPPVYNNLIKFYSDVGILLYTTPIPSTQMPVSAMTWGHNDRRVFVATGTGVQVARAWRRVGSLQLLARLRVRKALRRPAHLSHLPLPPRLAALVASLFTHTISCCVPEATAVRDFVSRAARAGRLHCTMLRRSGEGSIVGGGGGSGACVSYTLYLEHLGGLVPLLKGRRISKIRPEFVIFDPQYDGADSDDIHWFRVRSSGEATSNSSSSGNSSAHSNSSSSSHPPVSYGLTDSSDSDKDEGCSGSPRLQRRKKGRHRSTRSQPQPEKEVIDNPDDLGYIDSLPEDVPLVEVTSNIWGTKFKIHGLAKNIPANLGQVTYKTSLLHLQPRQMTLVMTELRDNLPTGPDPNFNPNIFSEDEEEAFQPSGEQATPVHKIKNTNSIDAASIIAPMSPRGNILSRAKSSLLHQSSSSQNEASNASTLSNAAMPALARAESYEDEFPYIDLTEMVNFCESLRINGSNVTTTAKSQPREPVNLIQGNYSRSQSRETCDISSQHYTNSSVRSHSSSMSGSSYSPSGGLGRSGSTSSGQRNGNSHCPGRHAISPLCCEGSVPTLQSPKNAVAPSDTIFDRPPAQTMMSYHPAGSDFSQNIQQVKSNMTAIENHTHQPFNLNLSLDHSRQVLIKKMDSHMESVTNRAMNGNRSEKESSLTHASVHTHRSTNLIHGAHNDSHSAVFKHCTTRKEKLPSPGHDIKRDDLKYIDEEAIGNHCDAFFSDSHYTHGHRSKAVLPITPVGKPVTSAPVSDTMIRSCSVGYLDVFHSQLVPCEVTLAMLRKDAPKRLVLVNKKSKNNCNRRNAKKQNHPTPELNLHLDPKVVQNTSMKTPHLKSCGKSKSLDSSDMFLMTHPTCNDMTPLPPSIEETIKTSIDENDYETIECVKSSCSGNSENLNLNSSVPNKTAKEFTKLSFFTSSKTPITSKMKKRDLPICDTCKCVTPSSNTHASSTLYDISNCESYVCNACLSSGICSTPTRKSKGLFKENKRSPGSEKSRNSSPRHTNDRHNINSEIEIERATTPSPGEQRSGNSLSGAALATLEQLLYRVRERASGSGSGTFNGTPPSSPGPRTRLPRSSPASPAPSKKNKRTASASPIRKHLLNSPLLNRRRNKSKNQESSDDEPGTFSGDEIVNGKNYRDLETFQKAQLRQKLKRGKIEPVGAGGWVAQPSAPVRREFVMHNKAPMWNESSQVYQLDFGGRVTQESAKNFQIEFRGKQVMQFGRIDGNAYTLDFQYPFSALQAFAVALANVTQRLK